MRKIDYNNTPLMMNISNKNNVFDYFYPYYRQILCYDTVYNNMVRFMIIFESLTYFTVISHHFLSHLDQ